MGLLEKTAFPFQESSEDTYVSHLHFTAGGESKAKSVSVRTLDTGRRLTLSDFCRP